MVIPSWPGHMGDLTATDRKPFTRPHRGTAQHASGKRLADNVVFLHRPGALFGFVCGIRKFPDPLFAGFPVQDYLLPRWT